MPKTQNDVMMAITLYIQLYSASKLMLSFPVKVLSYVSHGSSLADWQPRPPPWCRVVANPPQKNGGFPSIRPARGATRCLTGLLYSTGDPTRGFLQWISVVEAIEGAAGSQGPKGRIQGALTPMGDWWQGR